MHEVDMTKCLILSMEEWAEKKNKDWRIITFFLRRYRRDCQCQNMDGQGRSRENILCLHRVQLQSKVEKRCGKARGAAPFELEHSLPLPLWQHIFQQN